MLPVPLWPRAVPIYVHKILSRFDNLERHSPTQTVSSVRLRFTFCCELTQPPLGTLTSVPELVR